MFYYKQINPIGCFLWTILLVWLFFALKLYYVVGAIILIILVYHFINAAKAQIKYKKEEKERNFEPKINEVYKICPYCGNDVKRSASICPHCNNKLN